MTSLACLNFLNFTNIESRDLCFYLGIRVILVLQKHLLKQCIVLGFLFMIDRFLEICLRAADASADEVAFFIDCWSHHDWALILKLDLVNVVTNISYTAFYCCRPISLARVYGTFDLLELWSSLIGVVPSNRRRRLIRLVVARPRARALLLLSLQVSLTHLLYAFNGGVLRWFLVYWIDCAMITFNLLQN